MLGWFSENLTSIGVLINAATLIFLVVRLVTFETTLSRLESRAFFLSESVERWASDNVLVKAKRNVSETVTKTTVEKREIVVGDEKADSELLGGSKPSVQVEGS